MQDARTRLALLIVCLACLLGSGIVLLAGHRSVPPPITITQPPPETTAAVTPHTASLGTPHALPRSTTRLYVDVAGAVHRPSLYVLPPESRVMQAIRAAGGPTAEADLDAVNLAEKVADGEKVFVPKRGGPPPIPTSNDSLTTPLKTAIKTSKGAASGRGGKITAASGEQIALNTATEADLERLPSVGPSMAGRILAYRQQAGRFEKIEDLTQVTGIGPKKFAKIAPFVRLD